MSDRVTKNLVFENARIIYRNFRGVEKKYNPEGRRNFCVVLDPEAAEELANEGWKIKKNEPREEGGEPLFFLQVEVRYGSVPPKIVMISSKNKNVIDEEEVGMFDLAEIENVDLIVRPYNWEVNGKSGVKAYVKSMYITIVEDELEKKYADLDTPSEEIDEDDLPF